MSLTSIEDEFDLNGRISHRSVLELKTILESDDPYSAITLAVDTGTIRLADSIAKCLSSDDEMVRWNAAAGLFTRFRIADYAIQCLEMAMTDSSELVKNVCLVGSGELLPLVDDSSIRVRLASILDDAFTDETVDPERRTAAYEGMLAALDVLPVDRPDATKVLEIPEDTDPEIVKDFRTSFLSMN